MGSHPVFEEGFRVQICPAITSFVVLGHRHCQIEPRREVGLSSQGPKGLLESPLDATRPVQPVVVRLTRTDLRL